MKTQKQFSTLDFNGVKVRVCGNKAAYVNIGTWTIYVDNSTNEEILDTWKTSDPVDQVISLNEMQDEIQALRAENAALKAKLENAEEMQRTSIYWSPEDIAWFISDSDPAGKYKGIKLTEAQCRFILEKAIEYQTPEEGLTWSILEKQIDRFLLGVYPFGSENK